MELNKNTINHRGADEIKDVFNGSKFYKWFGEETELEASQSTKEWLWKLFEVLMMRAAQNN